MNYEYGYGLWLLKQCRFISQLLLSRVLKLNLKLGANTISTIWILYFVFGFCILNYSDFVFCISSVTSDYTLSLQLYTRTLNRNTATHSYQRNFKNTRLTVRPTVGTIRELCNAGMWGRIFLYEQRYYSQILFNLPHRQSISLSLLLLDQHLNAL